jgi:hypothetical protein
MEWRRMADALGLCAGGKLGHRLRIIFAGARGPHREPHCIDGSPAHCSSHVGEAPRHYGDVVGERGSRSRFDLWACPGLIYYARALARPTLLRRYHPADSIFGLARYAYNCVIRDFCSEAHLVLPEVSSLV